MLAAKGGLGLVIGAARLGFVTLDFREGGGNIGVFKKGNRHFVGGSFFDNDFAEFDAPEGLLDGGCAELFPEGMGHLLEALILDRSPGAVIGAEFAEVLVVLGGVSPGTTAMAELKPCLRAFIEQTALPSGVWGPPLALDSAMICSASAKNFSMADRVA